LKAFLSSPAGRTLLPGQALAPEFVCSVGKSHRPAQSFCQQVVSAALPSCRRSAAAVAVGATRLSGRAAADDAQFAAVVAALEPTAFELLVAAPGISDCRFRKTATEYDRKPGVTWLRCTAK
jgi:hypothetical protein